MNASTNKVLQDTQRVLVQINEILGTDFSIQKQGQCWYISIKENECMNGLWTEEALQRMYDETDGYLHALRSQYFVQCVLANKVMEYVAKRPTRVIKSDLYGRGYEDGVEYVKRYVRSILDNSDLLKQQEVDK